MDFRSVFFSDGLEIHPTANYGNCFMTIPSGEFFTALTLLLKVGTGTQNQLLGSSNGSKLKSFQSRFTESDLKYPPSD